MKIFKNRFSLRQQILYQLHFWIMNWYHYHCRSSYCCSSSCSGDVLQKSLKLCCFKSDGDSVWQDCPSSNYASTEPVGILMWCHTFKTAAMTSFHKKTFLGSFISNWIRLKLGLIALDEYTLMDEVRFLIWSHFKMAAWRPPATHCCIRSSVRQLSISLLSMTPLARCMRYSSYPQYICTCYLFFCRAAA